MIKHTENGIMCDCGNTRASLFAHYQTKKTSKQGAVELTETIDCIMCTECKDFIPYVELMENFKNEVIK